MSPRSKIPVVHPFPAVNLAAIPMKNFALLLSAGLLSLIITPELPASDWPQWRGPTRTGHALMTESIARLPKELTPLWRITVGAGHSGPVVSGRVLVYLDEDGAREVAHAIDTATGRELWKADYAERAKDEWGAGPRATPLIDGDRVYVQAMNGEFRCLNLKDGSVRWQTSYGADFGAKFMGMAAGEGNGTATRRGNSGSGVIDGSRIILPVGGTKGSSLVCFDKLSGKVLWKSGNDEAAYSSFMVSTITGVRQVVALTAEALLGAKVETGEILWRVPLKTAAKRHAASPVIIDDQVVVNSHTFGTRSFRIEKDTGGIKAAEAWANAALKINLASLVHLNGHLYGQGAAKDFVCVDAATGELKWSQAGFGLGKKDYASTIAVGDKLLALTEDGTLLLVAANSAKYTELGRVQVCGSTWSFPALADGRLYVRDGRTLQCLELSAGR